MTLRGRGAGVLAISLSLALSSCVDIRTVPSPAPSVALVSAAGLARELGTVLVRVGAYHYAVAGYFAGERVRVVEPVRYATALRSEAQALVGLRDRVLKTAFADRATGASLVKLAESGVGLADAMTRFGDARDVAAFAGAQQRLDAAWSALGEVGASLGADTELADMIARGSSWSVRLTTTPAFAVVTAAYGSREEAQRAATAIGAVEEVAQSAPFTVGVVTLGDRPSAERRVGELRQRGVAAAVVETQRVTVSRSGPAPEAELWREPALDAPTAAGARRANFFAGGYAVLSDDGTTFGFDDAGRPRWFAKLPAGAGLVASSPDGRWVVVGGVVVGLFASDGTSPLGEGTRLPSAATAAAWVGRRNVFVVGSQGPTGRPEGGGGRIVALGTSGRTLGDPFPLITPAAGPAIAAWPSDDRAFIATTSQGTTDVEVIRPGVDRDVRTVVRVAGQVLDLELGPEASVAVVVTAQGAYRFRPLEANPPATLELIAAAARDAAYATSGELYMLWASELVAYDAAMRVLWRAPVADGRRVLAGRRVVVQEGLARVRAFDPRTGASDELGSIGEVNDLALSADRTRLLLLVDGRRALVFTLP